MTGSAVSGRAGAGRLLGLGVRAAFSTPSAVLGVAVTLAAAALAWAVVPPALFLAEDGGARWLLGIGAGGLILLAVLARGVALAWAVRAGAWRIREEPGTGAVASAALTGLGWAIGAAAVHLAAACWLVTGLVGSGLALILGGAAVSLAGAVVLAAVSTLGALGAVVLGLWLEVALARAMVRPGGIALAGAEAWRTLGERPGFVVWGWVATVLPAFGVQAFVRAFAGVTPPAPTRWGVGVQISAVLLLALVEAVATVSRLDAYAALELDRAGELPVAPAPPPRPIPRATLVNPTLVVQARLVPPDGPGAAE